MIICQLVEFTASCSNEVTATRVESTHAGDDRSQVQRTISEGEGGDDAGNDTSNRDAT